MRERDIEALNHVLSDELGRWFFYRILDRAKLNSQSFTGNSTTFFNEGMRAVAILLQNDLGKIGDGVEGVKKYHLAQIENIQMQKYFKNLALIFAGWGAFFFAFNFYIKSNYFDFNSYVIKKYATFYI